MFSRMSCGVMLFAVLVTTSVITGESSGQTERAVASDKMRALQKERLEVLTQRVEVLSLQYESGTIPLMQVIDARDDLNAAKLEMAETNADRIKLLKSRVENLKAGVEFYSKLVERGQAAVADLLLAKSRRLEAEIELERELSVP